MHTSTPFLLGLGLLLAAGPVCAQPPSAASEVERLRAELETLREEYTARMTAIEDRLAALEIAAEAAPSGPPPGPTSPAPASAGATPVPAGAAGAGGPAGAIPFYGGSAATSKVFNPDVAVIGSFLGTGGSGPSEEPSLELREAEASFQAIVDPYARADFFFSYGHEGVEIEEGYVSFPALPGGFLLKGGKMRASVGKMNTLHTHAIAWADRPLVTSRLVGGDEGISDAGLSLSRLIPNPWIFLEATGEVYRGESELFAAEDRGDLSFVGRLRGYGDLSESANVELGGSFATGKNAFGSEYRTELYGADISFRYRPLRRAIYRRLLARSELFWSRTETPTGRAEAFGAYALGEYQFARRWYAGLRWDYSERALDPSLADRGGSLLLGFRPSEFSQIRAQFRHTRFAEGETANELLFQLLFSIGAHGAHPF